MGQHCDHDDTDALGELSKLVETPLNTPPTVVDIVASENCLSDADTGECSTFPAELEVLEAEWQEQDGLQDAYRQHLSTGEEAKEAHILTLPNIEMDTDTDTEDIDELQDDNDGHPGIARLTPKHTDPDADFDEIQDASELAIDVLKKDLDIDEIQDDDHDTRSEPFVPMLGWSSDFAARNGTGSPSESEELRSEENGEFVEHALQEKDVEGRLVYDRTSLNSSPSPRPSPTALVQADSLWRSSSPEALPPSTDFDEDMAIRSSSPTLLETNEDEGDLENELEPLSARCKPDGYADKTVLEPASSTPTNALERTSPPIYEEGTQVQSISDKSQDSSASSCIETKSLSGNTDETPSEQGLEIGFVNELELDADDGQREVTGDEGLPVSLSPSSSPPPWDGPPENDLNVEEEGTFSCSAHSIDSLNKDVRAFATVSVSFNVLGGAREDFGGQCGVDEQAGVDLGFVAKSKHRMGPAPMSPKEPQEKAATAKLPSPPVPKRATPAVLEQQMKKLSRPFQCPAIKPKPNEDSKVVPKPEPATEATGTDTSTPLPLSSGSGPSALNKLRYRTARAGAPFKSPVVGPGQTEARNRPGVRLTPAIQTLERKLQLLRRAVKVREEKQEETLRDLVDKWTEAGRDVAWEMWMLLKDRQDDSAKNGKRSYDESWGWSEEKRMKFEETVGGVEGMLMDLGISPQILGYDAIGSDFES